MKVVGGARTSGEGRRGRLRERKEMRKREGSGDAGAQRAERDGRRVQKGAGSAAPKEIPRPKSHGVSFPGEAFLGGGVLGFFGVMGNAARIGPASGNHLTLTGPTPVQNERNGIGMGLDPEG